MLLIFDIDLTICDNSMRKKKAFERALGRELSTAEVDFLSKNLAEDAVRIWKTDNKTNMEILRHFLYDEDLFELDKPMAGAVETVCALSKNHRIYYVTGRPTSSTAETFIKRNGFPAGEVYAVLVGPGESHKKIPLFKEVLRKEPGNFAVAIGDLYGDADAARKAGMYAVGIVQALERANYRKRLEGICDSVIDDMRELPKVIEKIATSAECKRVPAR